MLNNPPSGRVWRGCKTPEWGYVVGGVLTLTSGSRPKRRSVSTAPFILGRSLGEPMSTPTLTGMAMARTAITLAGLARRSVRTRASRSGLRACRPTQPVRERRFWGVRGQWVCPHTLLVCRRLTQPGALTPPRLSLPSTTQQPRNGETVVRHHTRLSSGGCEGQCV
jgi:hypothetical protein